MTWEQKLYAMQEIGGDGVRLNLRSPGDWILFAGSIWFQEQDGILIGRAGNGPSPEAAVEDLWSKCIGGDYVVVDRRPASYKHYRWTGFMWKELPR